MASIEAGALSLATVQGATAADGCPCGDPLCLRLIEHDGEIREISRFSTATPRSGHCSAIPKAGILINEHIVENGCPCRKIKLEHIDGVAPQDRRRTHAAAELSPIFGDDLIGQAAVVVG
jgi:hypothetical protein